MKSITGMVHEDSSKKLSNPTYYLDQTTGIESWVDELSALELEELGLSHVTSGLYAVYSEADFRSILSNIKLKFKADERLKVANDSSIIALIAKDGSPTRKFKLTTSNLLEALKLLKTYHDSSVTCTVKQRGCSFYVRIATK